MQEDAARLTADAIEVLARSTGLKVDGNRAQRLKDELERALLAVDALDAAIAADAPGTGGVGEFDAGWRDARGGQ